MTGIPRREIVLLLSSQSLKSRVVMEQLSNDDWFTGHHDLKAVTDQPNGTVPKLLEQEDISQIAASSPRSPSSEVTEVSSGNPDYIISCGWGHYVPQETIRVASIESLNCHGSYLPDYRGPNAYRALWANGCEFGGASVHILTDKFDDGRIIRRESFRIGPFDTPREIAFKASELTVQLLRESIFLIESGYSGVSNNGGSYYGKISWPRTILHGTVNNLARLANVNRRWRISPR